MFEVLGCRFDLGGEQLITETKKAHGASRKKNLRVMNAETDDRLSVNQAVKLKW